MKDRIYEGLDDKKLELLLQEYAEEEGRRLIEENERLREDSDFVVPESFSRACQETIENAAKREKLKARWRWIQKSLRRVAVFALVLGLAGGALFYTVDAFKFYILNSFVSQKDTNTRVEVAEESETTERLDSLDSIWLPEGYSHTFSDSTNKDFQIHFFHDPDGNAIELYYLAVFSGTYNVDSETSEIVKEIDINNDKGILVIKENIHVSWYSSSKNMWCDLYCPLDVTVDDTIKIAESLK